MISVKINKNDFGGYFVRVSIRELCLSKKDLIAFRDNINKIISDLDKVNNVPN
jgi:hypothetical protein